MMALNKVNCGPSECADGLGVRRPFNTVILTGSIPVPPATPFLWNAFA